MSIYNLAAYNTVDDFLQKVAGARGKLKKGGILDTEAAAKIVLHDWNEGMFPKSHTTHVVYLFYSRDDEFDSMYCWVVQGRFRILHYLQLELVLNIWKLLLLENLGKNLTWMRSIRQRLHL